MTERSIVSVALIAGLAYAAVNESYLVALFFGICLVGVLGTGE